jgi:hypothetical protein
MEDLGVVKKIILEWMLEYTVGRYGLNSSGSGQGSGMSCEHGNEPSGSIKHGEFFN